MFVSYSFEERYIFLIGLHRSVVFISGYFQSTRCFMYVMTYSSSLFSLHLHFALIDTQLFHLKLFVLSNFFKSNFYLFFFYVQIENLFKNKWMKCPRR